jgi:hypothetical protein
MCYIVDMKPVNNIIQSKISRSYQVPQNRTLRLNKINIYDKLFTELTGPVKDLRRLNNGYSMLSIIENAVNVKLQETQNESK